MFYIVYWRKEKKRTTLKTCWAVKSHVELLSKKYCACKWGKIHFLFLEETRNNFLIWSSKYYKSKSSIKYVHFLVMSLYWRKFTYPGYTFRGTRKVLAVHGLNQNPFSLNPPETARAWVHESLQSEMVSESLSILYTFRVKNQILLSWCQWN